MRETQLTGNKQTGGKSTGGSGRTTIELVDLAEGFQEPLVVAVYGEHGTGKSRLGATGPGNIGALMLDRKAQQTIVSVGQSLGKRVISPNINLVRASNPMKAAILKPFCKVRDDGMDSRAMANVTLEMDIFKAQPECCAIHYYRWHVQRVKYCLVEMVALPIEEIGTIVIDSCTNLWDDILFANHGRTDKINPIDRAPDNREMQEILGLASQKHCVLTHKLGEVWKNNKPTNEVTWKGYSNLGYEVGAILHMTRDARTGEFQAAFDMCQANAALHGDAGKWMETGLVDDGISMMAIGQAMYPGQDPEQWM